MRLILSLIAAITTSLAALATGEIKLPSSSPAPLGGFDRMEEVTARIAESGPHRIEGVWRFPDSGTTVAIERVNAAGALPGATTYRMVVVRSANRSIRPGTLIGILAPSAKSEVFDARMYTSSLLAGRLNSPKRFSITLSENNTHLVFKQVKSKYSFNFWRMLPYMFRYSVRSNANTGKAPQGCVKVFPEPEIPLEPRYL